MAGERAHGCTSSRKPGAGARRGVGWSRTVPVSCGSGRARCGDVPAPQRPGSVDRGEEATGGAVEDEASVLPGCALTESRQSLHVAPDRTGIRLVLLREDVRLRGLLLR